jgi:hypothetical protein
VLTVRFNLAQTLKTQGDLAGARGHEEAVLEAWRRMFGDEHPRTLIAQRNLAQTVRALESDDRDEGALLIDTVRYR